MDAIHITTVQLARADCLLTANKRQREAAQALGLKSLLIESCHCRMNDPKSAGCKSPEMDQEENAVSDQPKQDTFGPGVTAVPGAWQYPAGGALYGHTGIYPLDRSLIEGLDVVDRSVRELDQSRLGPILVGETGALNGGPPVTALLIQNTNLAMVCPELHKVHAGLAREDLFTCVHEQFMTETAAFADIVLPATSFLEHDDIYTASDHTTLQVARKLIEAPGEARENHFVIGELAKRLGVAHSGFEISAWDIMDQTLKRSGLWDAQTNHARGGQDFARFFETQHFLDGFSTADKKFHFRADWQRFGGRWREMHELPGPSM